MNQPKKALPRYFKILNKELKPKFRLTKLDTKIKNSFKILENCELCERKCRVNRLKGKLGWCRVGDKMKICSVFRHYGEEYFFVPSFTVFFWSCTFSCQYCQNWDISQRFASSVNMEEKELAKVIDKHADCKNMNFVGGDPTPYLPFVLKTLSYINADLPVVWNSNFYMTEKSMNLLKNVVDVYLSDFKYGNDKCAERLSKVKNYFEITKRNHRIAFKDSELVIRHLILPNHIECCTKPILDFIAENFKDKAVVNIMDQYRPEYKAKEYKEINRTITTEELSKAVDYAKELKLNYTT